MRLLTDNEIMAIADAEYVTVDLDATEVTAEVDAEMVMAGGLDYMYGQQIIRVEESYTPFRDYEYGY